jgi:hypothetical protein
VRLLAGRDSCPWRRLPTTAAFVVTGLHRWRD